MGDCCVTGYLHRDTTYGTETEVAGVPCYVVKATDIPDFKGALGPGAVLVGTDVYGWKIPNMRILADLYACRLGTTVYVPNILGDDFWPCEELGTARQAGPDVPQWMAEHSREKLEPLWRRIAGVVRDQHPRVVTVGFCYGTWQAWSLCEGPTPVAAGGAAFHPTLVPALCPDIPAMVARLAAPIFVGCPSNDELFDAPKRQAVKDALAKKGSGYASTWQDYADMRHGFAVRGDLAQPEVKAMRERAVSDLVAFFKPLLESA
ncbi:hypothetical protein CXG81DRAFT_14466 [Caulochytrium protostelioides]|uniref:Alpha/beta-hydrolase n=1 Tax=Caulochytrium protostelioides TaxID=1555241 RepID=A0A4P9WVU5_9FUNG|nr:alpha/beta-hydrolase [Caulochytrium protostelioides]RKO99474.1 hypothetical protein CXG81DRAFT_14466 [Caulochytrium protostelioides]|eukprot:RKO99474.1 hypothetical protein CXG81DRAFT_14466 [Caulochytrium protostelioides]